MSAPPPLPSTAHPDAAYRNRANLNVLSILFFIMGGLNVLALLLLAAILALGILQESNNPWQEPGGIVAASLVGILIFIMAAIAGLSCWAAICLRKPKQWKFCVVLSAVLCANFPLGTALGIYALNILGRPGVRALFDSPPSNP